MRYPASQTAEKHERILREAARLFRERGFDGAGVADIMKAAGLTPNGRLNAWLTRLGCWFLARRRRRLTAAGA